MRIDLHTHSLASDGTLTPAAVIQAAADAGLDVVALTDHDTAQGWPEASAAALECGIELVTGIEVSTRYGTTHVNTVGPEAATPKFSRPSER